jgi:hypothetical protein
MSLAYFGLPFFGLAYRPLAFRGSNSMAQTGFTPILHYASGTASAAPDPSFLTSSANGAELAINYTDGKLFYKDNAGAVQVLAWKTTPVTAGGTGLTSLTAGRIPFGNGTAALADASGLTYTSGTNTLSAPVVSASASMASAGNMLFSGTASRIQGDFSNATLANRTAFQDKTTNNVTAVYVLPNGTATSSGWVAFNNSDPTNAGYIGIDSNSTASRIVSANTGSGTAVPLTFVVGAGGPEVARFDTAGKFVVGGTTAIQNNSTFYGNSGAGQITLRNTAATAGKYWYFGPDSANNVTLYRNDGTGAYIVDGGTSWTANSDERLKTDLVPIQNAAAKVDSLRAVTGRYLTDDTGTSRSFLIAQDVQAVFPEAVKNNAQGYLGLSYTEVVPLLVAAVKELTKAVQELDARLVAIEAE